MCTRKDANAVLEQLQHMQAHEEKLRILERLVGCETCKEKPYFFVKGDTMCRCEIQKQTEFLNSLEHIMRERIVKK
jgi:hypothetical protein